MLMLLLLLLMRVIPYKGLRSLVAAHSRFLEHRIYEYVFV